MPFLRNDGAMALSRVSISGHMRRDPVARANIVQSLKGLIASSEGQQGAPRAGQIMPFGLPEIDNVLPGGGLARGGLHEVLAEDYGDLPASFGFCSALAIRFMTARPTAAALWCSDRSVRFDFGSLYGPGIAAFGFDTSRLVLVDTQKSRDLLWALEQAVRLKGLAAVIGHIGTMAAYDLTASRRLQLASAESGVPLLLLRGHGEAAVNPSAAMSRWTVAADRAGTGAAAWAVCLDKIRGVAPRRWRLMWDSKQACFRSAEIPEVRSKVAGHVTPSRVSAGSGRRLRAVG